MELESQVQGDVLILTPAENPVVLEAANAEAFRMAAEAAIGEARQVVLDMRPIEFVDSSGLSALIALERAQRRLDGGLCLVGLQRQVWTVFEITRLYRRFEIYDTLAEAVASFSAQLPLADDEE